jgi:hypothetical protein
MKTAVLFLLIWFMSTPMNPFSWLNGTWKMGSNQHVKEAWQAQNDTLMIGESFYESNGERKTLENMRIFKTKGEWFFEATVNNQNKGKAVQFKMVNEDFMHPVFENATHDFPRKISYNFVNADSISAYIWGKKWFRNKTVNFEFDRHE